MTSNHLTQEELGRYMDNRQAINEAGELRTKFMDHVTALFDNCCLASIVDDRLRVVNHPKDGYMYLKFKGHGLIITVVYSALWSACCKESCVTVFAEVQYADYIKALHEHHADLMKLYGETKKFRLFDFKELDATDDFCHFAELDIPVSVDTFTGGMDTFVEYIINEVKASGIAELLFTLLDLSGIDKKTLK